MAMEMGMGTDIRGTDYTKAATRAVHNALRQNSLVVADAFGKPREEMRVDIHIGVQKPEKVNLDAVAQELPYGKGILRAVFGGLNIHDDVSDRTSVIVNAGIIVRLPMA